MKKYILCIPDPRLLDRAREQARREDRSTAALWRSALRDYLRKVERRRGTRVKAA